MADGVTTQATTLATIPDATKIATDDAGAAGHVQLVKLALSANGSATALTADNTDGLLVNLGANNDVTVTGTVTVDGSGSTQPVSASSLPLPTGAATSANQATLIGHVDGIEALLTTIDADTSALAGAVSGTEVQVDVLTMPTVTVQDGGGSLTVDGTVDATQSGTWTVQPGNTANTTAWKVDASSVAVPVTDNGGSLTIDGAATSYLAQTRISATPTISAGSAYAAGDAVGGLLTFANAARTSGGTITVQTVVIIDKDQELAPLELVLFDRTFTATADNAAFDPSDADLANVVGVVKVSDYSSFNDNSVATRSGIGLAAKLDGTSLFGQLVVRSAPTYTADSDITVIVQVVQD